VQAGFDARVVANLAVVIVIEERMMAHRAIEREGGGDEKEAKNERLPWRRKGQASAFLRGGQQLDLLTPGRVRGITR
jgi:hypothetical protein